MSTSSTYERFSQRARKVMQLSTQEGQRTDHDAIRTEHMLLALLRVVSASTESAAFRILECVNADFDAIRWEIERDLPPGKHPAAFGRLPLTTPAKRVLESAMLESHASQHAETGVAHLLLGLMQEPEGPAAKVLAGCGLNLEKVRTEVRQSGPD